MSLARVYKDQDAIYLIQDISGLGTYEKAKAIVNFCDKETKRFEKDIDSELLGIFENNGIEIPNTDKSVLKLALDLLNSKHKAIVITDLFKGIKNDECEFIKKTKNDFTVILESTCVCGCKKEILQCGVSLQEKKL